MNWAGLEVLAPAALVTFAAGAYVYTQVLTPRRNRLLVAETLTSRGWTVVDPAIDTSWDEVMRMAVEESEGAVRVKEYSQRIGPLTLNGETTTRRFGEPQAVYRDASANRQRYAGVGTINERYRDRSGPLGMFNRTRGWSGRELWFGEARMLPVSGTGLVFDAFAESHGEIARRMARSSGVDPESIPVTATPPRDRVSMAVREVLLASNLAREAMASVYLGPRAWLLVVPINRPVKRLEQLIALAGEISAAIDGVER